MRERNQDLLKGLKALKKELEVKVKLLGLANITFLDPEIIDNRPYFAAEANFKYQPQMLSITFREEQIETLLSYDLPLSNSIKTDEIITIISARKIILEDILESLIANYSLDVNYEDREKFITPL